MGGRIYVTGDLDDDLVVFAFDLDGKPVWRVKNGRAWTGSFPGSRACGAYSEGKLYLLGSHGRLVCLEAASGKEVWGVELGERFGTPEIQWGLSECLLVEGPWVFVTPVGSKAAVAALDKQTGRTVWASEPLPDDRPTHSSPFLFRHGGQRILANCTASRGFAADADTGKLLWTVPLKSPYGVNVASPVYGSGQVFYATAYVLGACYRLPARPDGSALEKAWDTTLDTCTGTLVLVDGLLYGSGYRKHKSWVCLDWQTGQMRYESKGLTTSSAVYADGRLLCLAEDGRAVLMKPLADRFQIDGEFRLVKERVRDAWAHPVLLDGRLYLRYHDSLWCYAVRSR
jgi:outer membrane protein assembly factor BamB